MPASDYIGLLPNIHKDQPKFRAMVEMVMGGFDQVFDATQSLTQAFSVDHAVGVQLDQVGRWTGVSRLQTIPIPNSFFTFNDAALGWNQASWKGPYEATEGVTTLDDDTYRAVIKAQIGSNYWDGTDESLNVIGQSAFTDLGLTCFVIDNMDMTVTIYILGEPTAVLLEMIKRGIAPPKTAGVRVAGYVLASVSGAPLFALSVPTTLVTAGLDFGAFGAIA